MAQATGAFSNGDERSYPISVLNEMLDESHLLDEIDERMISLFDVRNISGQEMKQTTEKTINEGLSFSSFKRFFIELMQKIGLMSKDEHNGNERQ